MKNSEMNEITMKINETIRALKEIDVVKLQVVARKLAEILCDEGIILCTGNGGSLAQAQHFVGELVGRFETDREPFSAMTLGIDQVATSAINNDYGFLHVLQRSYAAVKRPNTALVLFSTSGESRNLIELCRQARKNGDYVVALVGHSNSTLQKLAVNSIAISSDNTATIQECHLTIIHLLAKQLEIYLCNRPQEKNDFNQ
ncbi:SIS domain-containing protein [Corynebacterium sp. CCM 9186]|uniref:D-sedoheptulose-7-phosphate isomerase n=1 Tax=Corynebacterium TaxID=1716 RepID=UPI002005950D|nr:SIS domain-containing protein [Corynebacterium meridianum]MCK7677079.1 SIS domain-containing protein [Corynebacterium meridianum]